jgi:hypothetical protein
VFPKNQCKQILYVPLTSPQQRHQNDGLIYYPIKRNKRDCAFTYQPRVLEKLARCHALYVQAPGSLFTLVSYHASMESKLHCYLGNEMTLQKIKHTTLAEKINTPHLRKSKHTDGVLPGTMHGQFTGRPPGQTVSQLVPDQTRPPWHITSRF